MALYTENCDKNKGHVSSFFKLSMGIRPWVFLLIIEVIAIIFRQSNNIKGLIINGTDIKLCQLADDMTLFLRETKSVSFAIKLFEVRWIKIKRM